MCRAELSLFTAMIENARGVRSTENRAARA